jgi:exopolysaccharide biosynthesis WecB/TagA/CpsF family protein
MTGDLQRSLSFLGLDFTNVSQADALELIETRAKEPGFAYIVTPNVDHVVRLHSHEPEPALWQSYEDASLRLCDSRILQGLARLSGLRLPLVTGSDLTARILERASRFRGVAVIGGDEKLPDQLAKRYAAHSWYFNMPPMGVRTDRKAQEDVLDFVEGCPADLFLVAIGSPQSELICGELHRRGRASGMALCIGASLEFLVGAKRRAPSWMQRAGLEWLFRLLSEPRRLWRRYLVSGPTIFAVWWRWRVSRAPDRAAFDSR